MLGVEESFEAVVGVKEFLGVAFFLGLVEGFFGVNEFLGVVKVLEDFGLMIEDGFGVDEVFGVVFDDLHALGDEVDKRDKVTGVGEEGGCVIILFTAINKPVLGGQIKYFFLYV